MRRTFATFVLLATACSGSGVSTTARTTADSIGEAGSDSAASADGGADSAPDADADADADSGDPGTSDGADSASTASATGADTTPAESDSGADTMPEAVGLQGAWLSEGENLSPLLVMLTHAVSIDATFGPNTFNVDTVDDQGQMVTQLGVYTAEPSGVGNIYNITLEQNMPQAITVEGIFEVDNTVNPPIMRYEVVQTEPSVGAVAPTAEGGFGSTSFGDDLTQIFVRQ
jgi:hypothetical protein